MSKFSLFDDVPRIVESLSGVFAHIRSEIWPFVLFFDKKQQNKEDVPCIKNDTVFGNCRCTKYFGGRSLL